MIGSRASMGLLLLLCLPSVACSEEGPHSKTDVLRLLKEALARYASLDLQAFGRVQIARSNAQSVSSSQTISVKRVDSQALISIKEVVERPGAETGRIQQDFLVYDNGDVLRGQAKLDSSLQQIDGQDGLAIGLFSRRLADTQKRDRKSVYAALNDAGAALWIIGYASLLDYLGDSSKIEIAQGDQESEILAVSEFGRAKLTVSSATGWLPHSIEIIKRPEHKTLDGLVSTVYQNPVRSVVWTVKVEGFASDSAGRWSPAKMDVERRTEWMEKPADAYNTAIELTNLTFDPPLMASDLQIGIVAPIGYQVDVIGADHLPYKWDGHAAVPGIPDMPESPKPVDYQNLATSRGSGGWLTAVITANGLLVLILIVFFLRKRGASH